MTKVIAVALPKGGVGKTTTAINLAASLAAMDIKTLLIDSDVSNNCATSLGFDPLKLSGGLINLVMGTQTAEEILTKTDLEYLDFIPTNNTTDNEDKIQQIVHNRYRLRDIIRTEFHEYEYVIIDTPPTMDGIINLVLSSIDSVLVPIKTSYYSLIALSRMLNKVEDIKKTTNKHIQIEGIVFTMSEVNTIATRMSEEKVYPLYGKHMFRSSIPKSTILAESTYHGKPVVLLKARSLGAEAYLKLAQELVVRNKICPVKELVKLSGFEKIGTEIPRDYKLYSNTPNPLKSSTIIKFDVPRESAIKINIYNIYMEQVEVLLDKVLEAGEYKIVWQPGQLPNGVYYYKFDAGSIFKMNKMILSR